MERKVLMIMLLLSLLAVLSACAPTPMVVRETPPSPREEIIGAAPSPAHVWIPGHWKWEGGWVWIPGHWRAAPHPGAAWVPGHWKERYGGWVWVPGRWREY